MSVRLVCFPAFLGVLLVTASACGGGSGNLDSFLDGASRERLQGIPADSGVLVVCAVNAPEVTLSLPDGFTPVGRSGAAALVEVGAGMRETLLPETVVRASVWGGTELTSRMDPRMRGLLLDAWLAEDEGQVSGIATFQKDASDLRERLTQAGVEIGSLAGPVVTVSGNLEAVLDLLAMPDLLLLSAPRQLRPSGSQ